MRKVELKVLEQIKYETIKRLVESGPDSAKKKRAALKINCSVHTVNRLMRVYKSEGKEGFSHKNKGRSPSIKTDEKVKREIIDLYLSKYSDANLVNFASIVKEDMGLEISAETIRLWLIDEDVVSPKAHRSTKKKVNKRLKERLVTARSKNESNTIIKKIELSSRKESHPRRERCKYLGETIQMDASEHTWVEGVKWHLHLAIDDASGMVVGAYFDYQETLNGYYHVLHQIIERYGIPATLYTDRRTVFDYVRKKRAFDYEDAFTQFSYACHKLGIEIKTTSVPEAKGRIERLNGTFQSRLPIELRRANVRRIEEANEFVLSYLDKYNKEFALQLNITKTVFVPQSSNEKINQILSVLSVRTVDGGNCVKFKNAFYMPINTIGNDVLIEPGNKVLMVETFDNKLYLNYCDELFKLRQLKTNNEYSKEFDVEHKEIKIKWTVPKNHPWRTQDFLHFMSKQKHRKSINQNLC